MLAGLAPGDRKGDMLDEHTDYFDPELVTSLAELRYCSTKMEGAVSAVDAYVQALLAGRTGSDELVAVCDRLKQYVTDFWAAYDDALRLLNQPTSEEILSVLRSIERNCDIDRFGRP